MSNYSVFKFREFLNHTFMHQKSQLFIMKQEIIVNESRFTKKTVVLFLLTIGVIYQWLWSCSTNLWSSTNINLKLSKGSTPFPENAPTNKTWPFLLMFLISVMKINQKDKAWFLNVKIVIILILSHFTNEKIGYWLSLVFEL